MQEWRILPGGALGVTLAVIGLMVLIALLTSTHREKGSSSPGGLKSKSLRGLVNALRNDQDPSVRCDAAQALGEMGDVRARQPLATALWDQSREVRIAAARALGLLRDRRAVSPLITALETNHLVVTPGAPAGSTSATFTPAGGGLAMGGGPKPKRVPVRNDRVLEALVTLTGVNFEWNAAAWRAWLVNERALPADFDPRRG